MTLSAEYTFRPARPDDAEAIARCVRDYTTETIGFADHTVEDTRDELAEPGVRTRVAQGVGGRVEGFATVHRKGDSPYFDVDVVALDDGVRSALFEWALGEVDHPEATVTHGVYRTDTRLRGTLDGLGFALSTTMHRMRIDHEAPAPPSPPPGLVLRQATDESVRPSAQAVLDMAFAHEEGHVPVPFDTWHAALEARSVFTWEGLWLAELDGRPVAALQCDDRFAEDENRGYVALLGVVPAARGRGVAKFLLRHAFAVDAAAGREGTVLHVDTNNVTPALGLYTSVGMRQVLVIDVLRRGPSS